MIIWVDDALFAVGAARDVDRLALIRNAEKRRHTLIVSETPTAGRSARKAPNFIKWKQELQPSICREVKILMERLNLVSVNAVTRGTNRLLVSETPKETPGCYLTLAESIRAVALPLYIIVENVLSDAEFLRRTMPPVWKKQLNAWERTGELVFENGGGNSVAKTIVEYFTDDKFARNTTGLPAEVWRLTHFVIYDHDGKSIDKPGDGAKTLTKTCRKAQMESRSYMLNRRTQENYLPVQVLKKIFKIKYDNQPDEYRQAELDKYLKFSADERYFSKFPANKKQPYKNAFLAFKKDTFWLEEWFENDNSWPEMTGLAEAIAAAI